MTANNADTARVKRYALVGAVALAGWLGLRGLNALSTQDLTVSTAPSPAAQLAAAPPTSGAPAAQSTPAAQPTPEVLAAAAAGKSPAVAKLAPKPAAGKAVNASEPKSYRHADLGELGSFKVPETLPADTTPEQAKAKVLGLVPEGLRRLDGEGVSVRGYMLPIDVDNEGHVKSFGLMPNQNSCCYGIAPAANGWVMVTLAGNKGVAPVMDVPVEVHGRLSVDPEVEEHELTGLYKLHAFKVVKPNS